MDADRISKSILTIELLFFVLFVFWTLIRGMNPEVAYTEKPMELAFINSILRSPAFPPQDPWLSGYAISYYYFGYVLIAMLTRVTGVASAIAFNLSSALWFSLTAIAAYGIVFDLVKVWQQRTGNRRWEPNLRQEFTPGCWISGTSIYSFRQHGRGGSRSLALRGSILEDWY